MAESEPTNKLENFSKTEAIEALTSSSYRQFSYDEIRKAINDFDGSSFIPSTSCDAWQYVMNISCYDVDGKSQLTLALIKYYTDPSDFVNETRALMNIHAHPNIISLIGYCIDSNKEILVFKYPKNGSLEDYIKNRIDHKFWSWKKRVELCLQVAYALQHLHQSTTEFPFGIVHGCLHSASILLDEEWNPIISDFTFSEINKIRTNYYNLFDEPNDVDAFGSLLSKVEFWHRQHIDYKDYHTSPDSLKAFINTKKKCNHSNRNKRPTIDEVVLDLKAVLKLQENYDRPTVELRDTLRSLLHEGSHTMEEFTESDSLDELSEVTNNLKEIMPSSSSISSSQKYPSSSSSFISSSSSAVNISSSSPSFNLFTPSYRQFSLSEINKVTNNLDREKSVREGLYWIEYLVQINLDSKTEETWVTVKQFKGNCTDEFEKQIQMVTKIQAHPNLISLLGYCIESGENILIYNFTEHGNLLDYVKLDSHIQLSWKERLNICLGAASGLHHLHRVTDEFHSGLIHGDVNSANILLDKKWAAKVSNYVGSHVKDPLQRYAPEYEKSNHLTKKVDVYAFGIVLFQVLCRRRIWEQGEESKLGYIEASYARWANENVDISIKDGISKESLREFTDCIGKCLDSNPYRRPSMNRVLHDIETALNFQEREDEANDLNASFGTKSRLAEGAASMSDVSFSLSHSCRRFPLNEVKDATNNFGEENRLGKGGEGTVYLAKIHLDSKTEKVAVAVKLLNKDFIGDFEKEIVTMTKLKHPNIVSLLGYCRESDNNVLIYEYMGKGSLSDYVKMNSEVCLSWKQRLNICLGAAYGLQHLHRETEEFPYGIIHRDVKPENILINDSWDAKVSDFGMLKLSNVGQTRSTIITAHTVGTPGYFAPECSLYSTKQLTRKVDVYSFGLVMFEVLCQKKMWEAGDESVYIGSVDVELLADENIDIRIKHQISESSKYKFIDTIAASLIPEAKIRLSMNDVVLRLEAALKDQEELEVSKEINAPS